VEQTIANYTLLRLLGRGGMGSVYEARQTALERRVAIKVLHKEFCEDTEVLKRFINEARVVNIIGHPGLVGVSEFGQTSEGAPFIVMEYVEGVTLREWIQRQAGRIPIEKVVRLSRQLASTLAAAHAKQIVHRDLKPVNIMLSADETSGELERVKILDFGIAKLGTENTSQTKSGVLMGTPAYMSPEQCRSARSAVDRSDVYALGVIMYEMVAGETPFKGGPALLMAGHLTMDPPPLSGRVPSAPPELAALIHRMLAKNPSDRPTAEEVTRSLAPNTGSLAVVTPPSDSPFLAPPSLSPNPGAETQLSKATEPAQARFAAVPIQQQRTLIFGAALAVLLLGIVGVTTVVLISGGSHRAQPANPVSDLSSPYDAGEIPDAMTDAAVSDSGIRSELPSSTPNPKKRAKTERGNSMSKGKGATAKKRGSRHSTK